MKFRIIINIAIVVTNDKDNEQQKLLYIKIQKFVNHRLIEKNKNQHFHFLFVKQFKQCFRCVQFFCMINNFFFMFKKTVEIQMIKDTLLFCKQKM